MCASCEPPKNSASAWRSAMAPRQLLLELEEVDMAAEKGPTRVRVDMCRIRGFLHLHSLIRCG
eukprot:scaffold7024_cov110-Isochrysis_galbana.AAC.2